MAGWVLKGGEDYLHHLDYIRAVKNPQWWSQECGPKMLAGEPVFAWMNKTQSLFGSAGIYARGRVVRFLPNGRDNENDLRFWRPEAIAEKRDSTKPHVEFEVQTIHDSDTFLSRDVLAEHPLFRNHNLLTLDIGSVRELTDEQAKELDRLLATPIAATSWDLFSQSPDDELRAKATAWVPGNPKLGSIRKPRNHFVPAIALRRSNGRCELCEWTAPKDRLERPILEVHHIDGLQYDRPDAVGAICPNCHAIIHRGQKGGELNARLRILIAEKESQH